MFQVSKTVGQIAGYLGSDHLLFDVSEWLKAFIRSVLKAHEVKAITHNSLLENAKIVAILVVKDEAPRLPFLFTYYRQIGVEHFVVIDNMSSDGIEDVLSDARDVSMFRASGNFRAARYGSDWVNHILRRYCIGKWILWIDADEMLVFSGSSDAKLGQLVAAMEKKGRRSLQTVMIDMYSAGSVNENVVGPGENPLTVCNLYDRSGYVRRVDPKSGATWIKGGVRGRLFFEDVWSGPALNKTPLVKWKWHYAFLKVAHQLWPRDLNGNGVVEGALLHFKFTATSVRKMTDANVRSQHTSEYEAYQDVETEQFGGELTTQFVDGSSLISDGLFDPVI